MLFGVSGSYFNTEHYTGFSILLFSLSSVFDYLAQLLKSMSYKYGDASVVTPFMYFQMIFMLAADIFLFGYSFSMFDVAGGFLVTASLLTPIVYKVANRN